MFTICNQSWYSGCHAGNDSLRNQPLWLETIGINPVTFKVVSHTIRDRLYRCKCLKNPCARRACFTHSPVAVGPTYLVPSNPPIIGLAL